MRQLHLRGMALLALSNVAPAEDRIDLDAAVRHLIAHVPPHHTSDGQRRAARLTRLIETGLITYPGLDLRDAAAGILGRR